MDISPSNIRFGRPSGSDLKRYRVDRLIWLTITFVVIGPFLEGFNRTPAAQLPAKTTEHISYGSRVGMEVTVSGRKGIGTSQAIIYASLTREDAKAYCEQYARDTSAGCIDNYLAESHLSESIGANCDAGTFSTFFGGRFRVDRVKSETATGVEYLVTDLKDGTKLDGSSASGLSYNLEQFYALCPRWKRAPAGVMQASPPRNDGSATVLARGLNGAPGAIICGDFQTVGILFRQFNRHWEESFQDTVTRGQSQLLRGAAVAAPDVEVYGCRLVPAGTPITLESESPFPIVSVELSGSKFRGVTLPGMYVSDRPMRR
jgi:hypothetical protein